MNGFHASSTGPVDLAYPGEAKHQSVMCDEVVAALGPRSDGTYVDATFGGGGHSRALLEAAQCRVFAIDRDPRAIAGGRVLREQYPSRLTLIHGRFSHMQQLLSQHGVSVANGIVLDLGLSSMQLEHSGAGFSFARDEPLDMRMDGIGTTAAQMVNTASQKKLADILHQYGEERMARRIARAIIYQRDRKPITSSAGLADIIRSSIRRFSAGQSRKSGPRIDPATRSFQAIRIAINAELEELTQALGQSEHILVSGGCLSVIAFHSLEDRIVKNAFRFSRPSRHHPMPVEAGPTWCPQGGCQRPSAGEVATNPRARSARLRSAMLTKERKDE